MTEEELTVDTGDIVQLEGKEYIVSDIQVTIQAQGDFFNNRVEHMVFYMAAMKDGTIKLVKKGSDNNRLGYLGI